MLKRKIWSLVDHTGEKGRGAPRGGPMQPSPGARLPYSLRMVDTWLMGETFRLTVFLHGIRLGTNER